MRTLLLVEPLLPPPRPGDAPAPCTAWVRARAALGGRERDAVLLDAGVFARGDGGWEAEQVGLALSEAGADAELWVGGPLAYELRERAGALGFDAQVAGPESAPAVTSLGPVEPGVLGNGLILSGEVSGACWRPGRVHLGEGLLTEALDAHLRLLRQRFEGAVPSGARTVHVEGSAFWSVPGRAHALASALSHPDAPFRLGALRWWGEGCATAFAQALRTAQALWLRGHPVYVELASAHPELSPLADLFPSAPTPALLDAVRTRWRARWPSPSREQERLLRLLDAPGVAAAVRSFGRTPPDPASDLHRQVAAKLDAPDWLDARRHLDELNRPMLVLIPTWQCELRCTYCTIPKQDGREMPFEVAERGLDLLLSSDAPVVHLHFFGGEPLMNWPTVQRAIAYGYERAKALGRQISFKITTNTVAATDDRLDWLARYPVSFQLSLDGDALTQRQARPSRLADVDSYDASAAIKARAFLDRGFPVDAYMVVQRQNVHRLHANFMHLLGLGFPRIQVNYAFNHMWPADARAVWGQQLLQIARTLRDGWADGSITTRWVNFEEPLRPVRTNGHITIDWDGTVYGGSAFLHTPPLAKGLRFGHLDDHGGFDRYTLLTFDDDEAVRRSFYQRPATQSLEIGDVTTTVLRWLHDQPTTPPPALPFG